MGRRSDLTSWDREVGRPACAKDAAVENAHVAADGSGSRPLIARTVRPVRATRRLAAAPGTVARSGPRLLAAVGVKSDAARRTNIDVDRHAAPVVRRARHHRTGFAQARARHPGSRDARAARRSNERQVAAFLSGAPDSDGGLQAPSRGEQQVLWTTRSRSARRRRRRRSPLRADQRQLLYLVVRRDRTERGSWSCRATRRWSGRPSANREPSPSRSVTSATAGCVRSRSAPRRWYARSHRADPGAPEDTDDATPAQDQRKGGVGGAPPASIRPRGQATTSRALCADARLIWNAALDSSTMACWAPASPVLPSATANWRRLGRSTSGLAEGSSSVQHRRFAIRRSDANFFAKTHRRPRWRSVRARRGLLRARCPVRRFNGRGGI